MNRILATSIAILFSVTAYAQKGREIFSLTRFRLATPSQGERVEQYLEKSLLPALHRAGITRIGVFKPVEQDTAAYGKSIWVLTPYASLEQFRKTTDRLLSDATHLETGRSFLEATSADPAFARVETTLMQAFTGMTKLTPTTLTGPRNERIYELRSYEGPSELKYRAKVRMFNDGDEIGLFKLLGFNAIFYAEVLSGSSMPNLMYMTTFDNMTSRDQHWKEFFSHPKWKELLTIEAYKNTVSKADIHLLRPTSYSDY